MFLNLNSSLCEFCFDGMFYSTPIRKCDSCGDSCDDKCAYQSKCFECSSGRYYDLDAMTCVQACSAQNQISIIDNQLGNKLLCRGFNYYVDSGSTQTIELGTITYPYKSIELVFVELLNYHAHSNRTISVYIKENTFNEFLLNKNFIINITSVNFKIYSSSSTNVPTKAVLIMKEGDVTMMSSQTQFSIIKNTDLRIIDVIQNNSGLTSNEKNQLLATDTCIFICRSTVTFDNFVFKSNFTNIQSEIYFIKPIYLQSKTLMMTNIDFVEISGRLSLSTDPLNLHLENITLDYYNLMAGFDNYITCNYPEANTFDQIIVKNFTAYQSQERTFNVKGRMISYYGAGNFTIDTATWGIYGSNVNDISPVELRTVPDCSPADSESRLINVYNFTSSLPENPYGDRFNQIFILFLVDNYSRKMKITNKDNNFFNFNNSFYEAINYLVIPTVDILLQNLTFTNLYSQDCIIKINDSGQVVFNQIYFYDIFAQVSQIIQVISYYNFTMDTLIWRNTQPCIESIFPHNSFYPIPNAHLSITNMQISSINLLGRNLMEIGDECSITIKNSNFKDLKVVSGGKLISAGATNGFNFSNITFTNITGVNLSDVSYSFIQISSFDLSSTNSYFIENIQIFNCVNNLFMLEKIINQSSSQAYFTVKNVSYQNSTIPYSNNLVYFGNIESQVDFDITFTNITFSNLIFERGGNMLYFQQQLKNPISFQNIFFSNITGGSITIESANKQRLDLPTKVVFQNLTANLLNGVYYSFINVLTGGVLEIADSSFSNIFNAQSGAVVYAGYTNSSTKINNSVFVNNTSLKGGVFNIEYNSVVVLNNCSVTNSFAVESAVVQCSNNGYYIHFFSKNRIFLKI